MSLRLRSSISRFHVYSLGLRTDQHERSLRSRIKSVRIVASIGIAGVCLTACGAASPGPIGGATEVQSPPSPTPPKIDPPAEASISKGGANASEGEPGGQLGREHTGQPVPSIVVRNDFGRTQHVFLDGQPVGRLSPRTEVILDVTPGTHTVTCAESVDPDNGALTITEFFEQGYLYRYRVFGESGPI